MDYETPDGSRFSLQRIFAQNDDPDGEPVFAYTSVSAYVQGVAYIGRLPDPPEGVDDGDLLSCLQPVPTECIHPKFEEGFTLAPEFDPSRHYLKAPSFTYEDCQPGNTFVADCVLREVKVLEQIRAARQEDPHSCQHLSKSHGVLVKDGRITHICLEQYPYSLNEYGANGLNVEQRHQIFEGVRNGILSIHRLGMAHNDINVENICVNAEGEPIIIDFDACLPFNEKLVKGVAAFNDGDYRSGISIYENDWFNGLDNVEDFLWEHAEEGSENDEELYER